MSLAKPPLTSERADRSESSKPSLLQQRITWLRRIVAVSFALELIMAWRLWSGPRTFPKFPLLDFIPTFPPYLDISLFVVLLVSLAGISVYPKPRIPALIFLGIVALLAICDQLRWMPFYFQFYFLLAALTLFAWPRDQKEVRQGQELALTTCQWIVASLYIYSGLQKLNIGFVRDVFPWFVEPVTKLFPDLQPWLVAAGFVAPFLETGIGIGLLVKPYRNYAVLAATALHFFILLMLGPLGHNWGKGVLPWNVSMIALVFILFWRTEPVPAKPTSTKNKLLQGGIIFLFMFMPMLSFFNLWDSYLSASLYSGNLNSATIFISPSLQQQLPAQLQPYVNKQEGGLVLDYFAWSSQELQVAPIPETRIFKGIARYLCTYASQPSDVTLVVSGKPTLFRPDKPATYTCADLSRQLNAS